MMPIASIAFRWGEGGILLKDTAPTAAPRLIPYQYLLFHLSDNDTV